MSVDPHSEVSFKIKAPLIKKHVEFLLNILCSQTTEVSIRFCGTAEMHQTNKDFRGKDKPTDVLSFEPDLSIERNQSYLGDVLICIPVCIQQAQKAKHSLSNELIKMLTHALVHLKGFDHERSQADARVMSKLEIALIKELNLKFESQTLIKA